MDSSALTNLPAVRLASGVEPQQKWPLSISNDTKLGHAPPKLIELTPTHGGQNTVITVVVQTLPPQIPAKLAFNSLMVDTKQMQAQGITSLVATVPPFQQTHSATANVPVSICFLDKDMVTETWLVADFTYEDIDRKENGFHVDYLDKRNDLSDTFHKADNNDFLNSSTAAYQNFYSPSVSTNYNFGAQVPNYQMGYQRNMFNEKYQRQAMAAAGGNFNYNNMNLFNGNSGFTSMLTSDLDQTSVSPMAQTYTSALPTPPAQQQVVTAQAVAAAAQVTSHHHQQQQQAPQSLMSNQNGGNQQQQQVYGFKSTSHTPTTSVANYQPYPGLVSRANLDIMGDLDGMAKNWSSDEWDHRRRLVQFWREQHGNKISCSFQPVPQSERASNSGNIVVSCIYWMERNDFFITSVDCIYLLECLMDIRFSVEEKNRIRRNLEGFRPLTVSKCKAESADFFKLIMSFPNPKPRNIEKDVKVFPWKTLPYALKKIVTKYTASSYNNNSKAHPRATSVRPPLSQQHSMVTPLSSAMNTPDYRTAASYPATPNSFTSHGGGGVKTTAPTNYFDPHLADLISSGNNNNNNTTPGTPSHTMPSTPATTTAAPTTPSIATGGASTAAVMEGNVVEEKVQPKLETTSEV